MFRGTPCSWMEIAQRRNGNNGIMDYFNWFKFKSLELCELRGKNMMHKSLEEEFNEWIISLRYNAAGICLERMEKARAWVQLEFKQKRSIKWGTKGHGFMWLKLQKVRLEKLGKIGYVSKSLGLSFEFQVIEKMAPVKGTNWSCSFQKGRDFK